MNNKVKEANRGIDNQEKNKQKIRMKKSGCMNESKRKERKHMRKKRKKERRKGKEERLRYN